MNCTNDCPYQIDDVVYLAVAYSNSTEKVPCPVCFGKLSVVLILGNGEHQSIECDFCGLGYKGPQGVVQKRKASSSVQRFIITGIGKDAQGWYITKHHQREYLDNGNVFPTQAGAEGRRVELYALAEVQAKNQWELNIRNRKSKPTWSVGYHREELKELRRKAQYHEEKLREKKHE